MIRIACPACDQMLRIPDSLGGRMVACPKCKEKFRVPEQIEPLESDEDADDRISTAPPPRAKPRKLRPPVDEEDEPLPKPKRSRAKEDDEDRTPTQLNPNRVKNRPAHGVAAKAHRDADAGPYLASGTKTTTVPISALIAAASF